MEFSLLDAGFTSVAFCENSISQLTSPLPRDPQKVWPSHPPGV
jgi:hypothetical protein